MQQQIGQIDTPQLEQVYGAVSANAVPNGTTGEMMIDAFAQLLIAVAPANQEQQQTTSMLVMVDNPTLPVLPEIPQYHPDLINHATAQPKPTALPIGEVISDDRHNNENTQQKQDLPEIPIVTNTNYILDTDCNVEIKEEEEVRDLVKVKESAVRCDNIFEQPVTIAMVEAIPERQLEKMPESKQLFEQPISISIPVITSEPEIKVIEALEIEQMQATEPELEAEVGIKTIALELEKPALNIDVITANMPELASISSTKIVEILTQEANIEVTQGHAMNAEHSTNTHCTNIILEPGIQTKLAFLDKVVTQEATIDAPEAQDMAHISFDKGSENITHEANIVPQQEVAVLVAEKQLPQYARLEASLQQEVARPNPIIQADVTQQVALKVAQYNNEQNSGKLVVELHPQELGKLEISIQRDNSSSEVIIAAEKFTTLDMLQRSSNTLWSVLQDIGYTKENTSIVLDILPQSGEDRQRGEQYKPKPEQEMSTNEEMQPVQNNMIMSYGSDLRVDLVI
ncbi:MAG: flagellar hook-length control protein FliK [Proteobacteria bacterium]|nr:flagellar hook-length control protein FliK [Pseudomonadota bacterium]